MSADSEARQFCAACPVQRVCLDYALENKHGHGIWGGRTEDERDYLHRKLRKRKDEARVAAALLGEAVHLTSAEREHAAALAHRAGMSATVLARLIRVTVPWAAELLDVARQAAEKRSAQPGEDDTTVTPADAPAGHGLEEAA